MSSIRIKFTRGEEVKYISHLDLMRTFERALRRSGLPVAYSQGFNPHPQVVFGLPLSVGITSESEYADIELAEQVSPQEFMDRLNKVLPDGIRVIDAAERSGGPNIMASIIQASYRIYTTCSSLTVAGAEAAGEEAAEAKATMAEVTEAGVNETETAKTEAAETDMAKAKGKAGSTALKEAVRAFLGQKEVAVEKEGKQGVRTVDIRPMVKSLEAEECKEPYVNDPSDLCLSAVVSAGSKANLKPELLMAGFNKVTGAGLDIIRIHRTGLFVEYGGKAADPLDRRVLAGKQVKVPEKQVKQQ